MMTLVNEFDEIGVGGSLLGGQNTEKTAYLYEKSLEVLRAALQVCLCR